MKLDDELMFADDLPVEARQRIERVDATIAEIRADADKSLLALRDAADREIEEIRTRLARDEATVQTDVSRKISPIVKVLFEDLKSLQIQYMQRGMLDEALAIRSRIRTMRADLLGVRTDPGNMTEFSTSDIGKSFLFDLTGDADGNVWGTDLYTGDSHLSTAAIHSGVLKQGERGLVRVTLIDGSGNLFDGTERHGVRSQDYGNFSVAYAMERV